ncbi:hypothetical protein JKA74_08770 [Marivirga sp. S37H4]|uniref:Uncharacterized protein n=1 Tax=Marivirga aurantiaca TaxID=2802615 RepID=A0A934WXS8_9BACT|nr:contractile injection system tape measure protein [Marivirga aurantiaca]MBK6265128.1 hypothetical protein [Marivirga aurantiaca]
MSRNHHIEKQRIIISAKKGENLSPINKEIQESNEESLQFIEKLFDKYIPEDKLIEINSIHLDLGSLKHTNFKKEYQRRLISLLEAELKKLTKSPEFKAHVSKAPLHISDRFSLLASYFLKGYAPALQNEPGFEVNRLVEELMSSDQQAFAKQMLPAWNSAIGQKRIQHQLQPALYQKFFALMQTETAVEGTPLTSAGMIMLSQYFKSGSWPEGYKGYSLLKQDLIFSQLKDKERKKLVPELFKLVSQKAARSRMAGALSLQSLKTAFSTLQMLRQSLSELEAVERELRTNEATAQFLNAAGFRSFWLEYLSEYRQVKGRAKLLMDLLDHQIPGFLKNESLIKRIGQIKDAAPLLAELKKREAAGKELTNQQSAAVGSSMNLFLHFLETGLLPAAKDLHQILSGLLSTHSVLLAKMLRNKWNLYTVRYRLAYQTRPDHLIRLVQLLFGETNYLAWLEEMFDTGADGQLIDSELSDKIRRDLYFAFFEVIAESGGEEIEKGQFYELYAASLANAVPALDPQELLKSLDNKAYAELGAHIIGILGKEETGIEKKKGIKALLSELISEGTTSLAYKEQFPNQEILLYFIEEAINKNEFSVQLFLQSQIHPTFWSELLPSFENKHLEKMTVQVATFQKASVLQVLDELQLLEKEMETGAAAAFYPLAKDIYVVLLKALAKSNFSMSSTQLTDLMYAEVFSRLKKERTAVVYENLMQSLSIKSSSPFFQEKHPKIVSWLKKNDDRRISGQSILTHAEGKKIGIKKVWQDQYTTTDLLLFYLEKERLPDWSSLKSEADLKPVLEQIILQATPAFKEQLRVILSDKKVVERLLNLLKADIISQLIGFQQPAKLTQKDILKWAGQAKIPKASSSPIKEAYKNQYTTTDLLLFYLEKDDLPDWSSLKSEADVKPVFEQAIFQATPAFKEQLRFILSDKKVAERLLSLLNAEIISQLIGFNQSAKLTQKDVLKWAAQSKIPKASSSPIKETYQDQYTTTDLLLFYLEKDDLPDWSSLKSEAEVKSLMEETILAFEPEFLAKIRPLVFDEVIARRLFSLIKPATLKWLLKQIDSRQYELWMLLMEDLLKWATQTKVLQDSPGKIEAFLQLYIMKIIFMGSSHVAEADVNNLLRNISRLYKFPYHQLIGLLQKEAHVFKSEFLKRFIGKEYAIVNLRQVIEWRKSGLKPSKSDNYSATEVILYYLTEGTFPGWSTVRNENEMKQLLGAGLKHAPAEFMEVVFQLSGQEQPLLRLAALLKIAQMKRVLRLLDETQWPLWETILEDLVQFQQRSLLFKGSETSFKSELYTLTFLALLAENKGFHPGHKLLYILLEALSAQYQLQPRHVYQNLIVHYPSMESEILKAFIRSYSVDKKTKETKAQWHIEGILESFHSEYTTVDLILYYLKTRTFPAWSTLKSTAALRALITKGMKVAVPELMELVRKIQGDDFAGTTFTGLLDDKTLHAVLKMMDQQKFRSFKAIADDFLKTVGLAERLSLEKSDLKTYMNFLLLHEVSGSESHYPAEKFAAFMIAQIAGKFALGPDLIYQILEEKIDVIKSRPLRKAIHDQRSPKHTLKEEKETVSSLSADIDAFLYMLAEKSIPWWYLKTRQKPSSLKVEIQRLYKFLLKEHFNELIAAVQNSGREIFYLTEIFGHITLNEFNRIVSAVVPGVSGFVLMYTRVLEILSVEKFPRLAFKADTQIYVHIYQYIRAKSSGFTASAFTQEVSRQIADYLKIDFQELMAHFSEVAETMIAKGEPKFKTFREVLQTVQQMKPADSSGDKLLVLHEESLASEEDFPQSLAYYLLHGSMPFRSKIKSYNELLQKFEEHVKSNPLELKAVLTTALTEKIAVERMLHHGTGLIFRMAAFIYHTQEEQIEAWLKGVIDFMHSGYPKIAKSKFEALAVQVLVKSFSSPGPGNFDQLTLTKLFFTKASAELVPQLMSKLPADFTNYRPAAGISKVFIKVLEKIVESGAIKSVQQKAKTPELEANEPLEGRLEVYNAGAVILATFLPRYFDMLGMISKKVFHDQETAVRAVHLLQYLVSGKSETPEHELAFMKVLCGVDLSYPIPLSIELTEKEIEISESLLKGVLQNWDKLKSTSIEALRDGFLIRKGYLNETPHNWELQVEKSGRDILLDYLPWSFNTIKLSWMQKSLNVQWRK